MADITMCNGKGCDKKESCYRFTAKPSKYQSQFVEPPIQNGECEEYWPNEKKEGEHGV